MIGSAMSITMSMIINQMLTM